MAQIVLNNFKSRNVPKEELKTIDYYSNIIRDWLQLADERKLYDRFAISETSNDSFKSSNQAFQHFKLE